MKYFIQIYPSPNGSDWEQLSEEQQNAVFGEYMEIQNADFAIQKQCMDMTVDLANRMGLPLVATNDAHYLNQTDAAMRTGWSVLIQGAVHHVDDAEERASLLTVGLEPWAGGERALFLRIVPSLVTGRRISRGS